MARCNKIEGILAESLYEELSDSDRARLEAHLADCETCRQIAAELRAVVSAIPVAEIRLETDLLPGIRAKIDSSARANRVLRFRPALALAAALLFVVGVGVVVTLSGRPPADPIAEDEGAVPAGRVDEVFARAEQLVGEHNYSGAYMALGEVEQRTQNAEALGRARLLQAQLAFDELHWYPEAHTLYDTLRRQHGDLFRSDTENIERINVLDEARGPQSEYASLHGLDAARRSRSFTQFETLVSRYPGTYVASAAVTDMARIASEEFSGDRPETAVASLEAAMDRCDSPVAIAQLKVEIAHTLQGDDEERARAFYRDVAESGVTVLAGVARDALDRMDVGAQPQ